MEELDKFLSIKWKESKYVISTGYYEKRLSVIVRVPRSFVPRLSLLLKDFPHPVLAAALPTNFTSQVMDITDI